MQASLLSNNPMKYLPPLTNARFARAIQLGPLFCAVLTDCESDSKVQYAHVMFVHKNNEREPIFAVASEANTVNDHLQAMKASYRVERGGSHFLGVFPCEGQTKHYNLGTSDDWADLDKFINKAVSVVAERFSIVESPKDLPIPSQQQTVHNNQTQSKTIWLKKK